MAFIAKALPIRGKVLARQEIIEQLAQCYGGASGLRQWSHSTWDRGIPGWKQATGPTRGYAAEGYLGQFLVVLPKQRLVAVRQREGLPNESENERDARSFGDFEGDLLALFASP